MIKQKSKLNTYFITLLFSVAAITFNACSNDDDSTTEVTGNSGVTEELYADTDFETTDWTTETHTKNVDPNFNEVFEDNTIKRLDVVVSNTRWQNMQSNMTDLYGAFGTGSSGPNGGGPGGQGQGTVSTDLDEDPMFVPANVLCNGLEWYRVGIRFKGNSSLRTAWQNGNLKLSLKLDFDEFEDQYPQIDNQRFYGFKKLSLKNNFDDKSMIREKVAGDVFRNAGLAGSHTAFYRLYVDHGDGPQYFGVYTMVEEVDDTVLDNQFSDDNGNLYKPDGNAASFASGSYNEDEYVKKSNEDEADFSDVSSLLSVLHNNTRLTNAQTWRADLDAILDTDVFLKYLAVNTVIQNWDTYGRMTHNYYLYNNPDTSKLTWIPWDNNEALQLGKLGGSLPLDFSGLNASDWPLISYMYQDATYREKYDTYVQDVVNNAFNASTMQSLYNSYSALLEPYATTELPGYTYLNNSSEFQTAINTLSAHVSQRATDVINYLN